MEILILVICMSIFLLCIKIFFTRIIDVTLGTFRTVVTIKNKITLASIIGFFEVLIWFIIAKEALESQSNIWVGIAYATGFAAGTYIGGILSRYLVKGNLQVQIITSNMTQEYLDKLRKEGFGVSVMDINQKEGEPDKYLLLFEINNKDFEKLNKLIKKKDKNAFIIVNESIKVINGYFGIK